MTNTVSLNISKDFVFNRCRACDARILWFAVMIRELPDCPDMDDINAVGKPYIFAHQAPGTQQGQKSFCPYCGKKELWAEDEQVKDT